MNLSLTTPFPKTHPSILMSLKPTSTVAAAHHFAVPRFTNDQCGSVEFNMRLQSGVIMCHLQEKKPLICTQNMDQHHKLLLCFAFHLTSPLWKNTDSQDTQDAPIQQPTTLNPSLWKIQKLASKRNCSD